MFKSKKGKGNIPNSINENLRREELHIWWLGFKFNFQWVATFLFKDNSFYWPGSQPKLSVCKHTLVILFSISTRFYGGDRFICTIEIVQLTIYGANKIWRQILGNSVDGLSAP